MSRNTKAWLIVLALVLAFFLVPALVQHLLGWPVDDARPVHP